MKPMQEAIYNEDTLIRVKEGHVTVYRVHPTNSVKGTLRELSEQHGFEYQKEWNTRSFGAKLIADFGGKTEALIGSYLIRKIEGGAIEVYRICDAVKNELIRISEELGIDTSGSLVELAQNIIAEVNRVPEIDEPALATIPQATHPLLQKLLQDIQDFFKTVHTFTFYNEASLQLNLSNYLINTGHYASIEVEYLIVSPDEVEGLTSKRCFIDVVVKSELGEYALLELKYPLHIPEGIITSRLGSNDLKKEDYAVNQGAQNVVRYLFWKDVKRIEYFSSLSKDAVGGIALLLTNDSIYWTAPKNEGDTTALYREFTLKAGQSSLSTKSRRWREEDGTERVWNSYPGFDLEKAYPLYWGDPLTPIKVGEKKDLIFQPCFVVVEK
ncbi:MAG: hypothetical protein HXN06_03585 [Porphyromonadaceae bacterium]|nr:hypothetical protein [Porphyromonadaceae bacterium]